VAGPGEDLGAGVHLDVEVSLDADAADLKGRALTDAEGSKFENLCLGRGVALHGSNLPCLRLTLHCLQPTARESAQ